MMIGASSGPARGRGKGARRTWPARAAPRPARGRRAAELLGDLSDDPIDDATVTSVKDNVPGAVVLADLLEPLYDTSIPTRDAAHTLGRVKIELEAMVESGARVVVICRRRTDDLGPARRYWLRPGSHSVSSPRFDPRLRMNSRSESLFR